MDIFNRSWSLLKSAWQIIRSEPSLLWFPIVSAILVIISSLVFLFVLTVFFSNGAVQAAMATAQHATSRGDDDSPLITILAILTLFIYYLMIAAIANYFAVGMAGAALRRLDQHDTSFGAGLGMASRHLGAILGFSAMAATVGVALTVLRSGRRNRLARAMVARVGEAAWNVTTFLVVPIIADRNVGPLDAVMESGQLLHKTWGEQIVGAGGMGVIFGLTGALVVLVTGGLGWLLSFSEVLMLSILAIGVLLLVILWVLSSTLGSIYKAAVYHYASRGQVDDQFDASLIQHAFHLQGAEA